MAATVLAALIPAGSARAQIAGAPLNLSPVSTMYFVRAGTFEVWQDTTKLGNENYSVYLTAGRDSVIAYSFIEYELTQGTTRTHYEKSALRVNYAVGNKVKVYQTKELIGDRTRALALSTFDTLVTTYRESDGHGQADVKALPTKKFYVLDPSIYEQVETMTREFLETGLASRKIDVMIPMRDTMIQVTARRGPKEKIDGALGKKVSTQRVDIQDELTEIRVWLDESGDLVLLEAPAQKVRVRRLPPGEDEAKALAIARGPANAPASTTKP